MKDNQNIYISDSRVKQRFKNFSQDEIDIPDNKLNKLCIDNFKPFELENNKHCNCSKRYCVTHFNYEPDLPKDKTSDVIPLPVTDLTNQLLQYTLDRVNYKNLLDGIDPDNLDTRKEL